MPGQSPWAWEPLRQRLVPRLAKGRARGPNECGRAGGPWSPSTLRLAAQQRTGVGRRLGLKPQEPGGDPGSLGVAVGCEVVHDGFARQEMGRRLGRKRASTLSGVETRHS